MASLGGRETAVRGKMAEKGKSMDSKSMTVGAESQTKMASHSKWGHCNGSLLSFPLLVLFCVFRVLYFFHFLHIFGALCVFMCFTGKMESSLEF